jgi:hypothetical protein
MIARYGRRAFPLFVSMLLAIAAETSNVHAEAAVPSADAGQALCSKEGLIALLPSIQGAGWTVQGSRPTRGRSAGLSRRSARSFERDRHDPGPGQRHGQSVRRREEA